MKSLSSVLLAGAMLFSMTVAGQGPENFEDGITIAAEDESFEARIFTWAHLNMNASAPIAGNTGLQQVGHNFHVNRARLGVLGHLLKPEFRYNFHFSFANAETRIEPTSPTNGANIVLDAFVEWEPAKGFVLSAGQRFLPGVREAFTAARTLQFVNRSSLFSFSGYDRDAGLFSWYDLTLGNVLFRPQVAVTKGEGRNIGTGNRGGLAYTLRGDVYPLGRFKQNNDIFEADIDREPSPKLAIGGGYELNDNASRENGHSGAFVPVQRDVESVFADVLFKFNGISFLGEYFEKSATIPVVYDTSFNEIAVFQSGRSFSFQGGYLFQNNLEIAGRYTQVLPTQVTGSPQLTDYTLAISKYIKHHNVKCQADFTYREKEDLPDPQFIGRFVLAIGI